MSTTASSYDVPRLVSAVVLSGIATVLAIYSKNSLWPPGLAGLAFIFVTALYGIMMFASSYVEEEQHFWYWITPAWIILLAIRQSHQKLQRAIAGFVVLAGSVFYLWQNPPASPLATQAAGQVDTLQTQVTALRDQVTKLTDQKPTGPSAAW